MLIPGKDQPEEGLVDQTGGAVESHLKAPDEAPEVPPSVSGIGEYLSESRLATFQESNDPRHGGSNGSLGFPSHGSQGLEKLPKAPHNEDDWIWAWIEQCDFRVPPQSRKISLSACEDGTSCHETHATDLSASPYNEDDPHHGSILDLFPGQLNDSNVLTNVTKQPMELAERCPRHIAEDALQKLYETSSRDVAEETFDRLAERSGWSIDKQSFQGFWDRRLYPQANSDYPFQADTGQLSNGVSLSGSHRSLASSRGSLAGSLASSAGSNASLASCQLSRKGKRKATDLPGHDRTPPEGKPYQCTSCFKAFKRRQECNRHESSVHFALKQYVCMPNGSAEPKPSTPSNLLSDLYPLLYCVFCGCIEPDPEHQKTQHGMAACLAKDLHERSFPRKDGLVQHIIGLHSDGLSKDANELVERWTRDEDLDENIPYWDCGFCGQDNMRWRERCKHVGKHFKDGADMRKWLGRDPNDRMYRCQADFEPFRTGLPCQGDYGKRDMQFLDFSNLMVHMKDYHGFHRYGYGEIR